MTVQTAEVHLKMHCACRNSGIRSKCSSRSHQRW
jgi:hypothetical protein